MPIDLTRPRKQYRFNVSCGVGGFGTKEWPWPHLFKTKWQDIPSPQAKRLFKLLKKRFPEEQSFEVTAYVRTKGPRAFEDRLRW